MPYAEGVPESVLSDVVVLRYNNLEDLETRLPRVSDDVAGVLVDVMPARLGLVSCDPAWLETLWTITRDLGLLLVSDEVITFRLAHGGAQEHFGFDADLTTFGKVIGGGLPVGAIGGDESLMRVFRSDRGAPAVPHSGTFNANPVTMAAGCATLELLTLDEVERINGLGARLRSHLTAIFELSDIPAHVTGDGSLFQIHLTAETFRDYRSMWHSVTAKPEVKRRQHELYCALLHRGVLLGEHGVGAISTPMTHKEVDLFASAVEDALSDIDVA